MIEYCARTVDLTKNIILEQDPKQYKKQCSRHFLKGIILEDETGEISKLKDFAIQQFYKPIERNTDQEWVEMSKYIIWGGQ